MWGRSALTGVAIILCLTSACVTPAHQGTRPAPFSDAELPPSVGTCQAVRLPVAHPSGAVGELAGVYCVPVINLTTPTTLQFVVHGGTYSHNYWAWPQHPEVYSYVDKAVRAGYAVLAIDRLGDGASSRPASSEDSADAQIATLRQAILAARNGSLGPHYGRVEYVGHSFGSYYGVALASRYPYLVDALLLTGFGAHVSAATAAFDSTDDVSAKYLPRFGMLDEGYITNKPGTRIHHLYYLPDADPAVISEDEKTEDTLARTELATRPKSSAIYTQALPASLPVMIINGNHDLHYCTSDTYDCSATSNWYTGEAATFPPGACLAGALEESGHVLQLHRSARVTDQLMLDWSRQVLAPNDQQPPRCPVRGPIQTPGITFSTGQR